MEIIGHSILALSIIGVLWQFIHTRRRARNGEVIVPPFFAGLLIFSVCLVGVIVLGASRLHLLWLFPASYVLGTVLLFAPVAQKILMTFLVMIAVPRDAEDNERGPAVSRKSRKRAKRPSGSKKGKR
jgi:hypothetical protein